LNSSAHCETLLKSLKSSDAHNAFLELSRTIARNSLIDFTEYTFPQYSTQWFHRLVCDKLDALYNGTIKKLMVFMPPQHGKSEFVSKRFPAYALGKNPDLKIAVCTYAADLASRVNRSIQRIIDDPKYYELFPNTKLNSKNIVSDARESFVRNSDEFEIVGCMGGLKAVGVGGPLTGNPVDIAIIDDPVKDAVEGQSPTDRKRKWEWYTDVLSTRLHNNSRVLLTMTRWHEDDLAGRILAHEAGQWDVLMLPYIKDCYTISEDKRSDGEALWPDKHSAEKAMLMKANSERTFASLMQQRPAPLEGGIFKRDWWKFYDRLPSTINRLIMSWDCAFDGNSTSDYVVGLVMAKNGADTYIVDMVREKLDFVNTVKQIKDTLKKYPYCQEKYIEKKANGAAIINLLKDEIVGLVPITPTESKESRANAVSYVIESGHVYLPANAPWKDIALYEFSSFPNGANDDIVDALTQGLNKLYTHNGGQALRIAI